MSAWANDLAELLRKAEEAERRLSYVSPCGSEAARKQLGSYYTPTDVARFFWAEFTALNDLKDKASFSRFWETHHFLEPAVGAGALVFALLEQGGKMGLSPARLAEIELTLIDINQAALDFVQEQFSALSARWGVVFRRVRYLCGDYINCALPASSKAPVFFGNPPFVANAKEGSRWKNLFADFLERSIQQSGRHGCCHFIVPVSVAFSRDYALMRECIRATGKSVALSSFDNIPDTLFYGGKPENTNTNKANSQRCSILTIFPESTQRILSSRMHRWGKEDRVKLLSSSPSYHDVTRYGFDDQFPRPESEFILRYLDESLASPRFQDLLSATGDHGLFVAPVARNFVGFREMAGPGVHALRFATYERMYAALIILSSSIFLDYWRTVGDGFHVTRSNILGFPLHESLMRAVMAQTEAGQAMWAGRETYAKAKRHPNGMTISYDFRRSALTLMTET